MKKFSEIRSRKKSSENTETPGSENGDAKKSRFRLPEIKKPEFRKKNSGDVKIDDRWYMCLLPAALTMLIYSIILAVKGIYPFGNATIDYYDMGGQIAPFYYHVFDALHGTKGFFYDWYSALGTNMAMSTSGCSNISPFNLFFLFINRSSLLPSLSVFNGIKLMCMSLTMYFYLNKTHAKSPFFFKLTSAVGYAFCGFVLVLYITNQWVDIAVFFPLIMYFYDKLITEGRMTGYIITLAVTIIASYYLGFMILIFLFLYTGLKMVTGYLFDGKRAQAQECVSLPAVPEAETTIITMPAVSEAPVTCEKSAETGGSGEDAGLQPAKIVLEADGESGEIHAVTEEVPGTETDKKKKFSLKKPDFTKFRRSAEGRAEKASKKPRVKVTRSLPDLNLARLGLGTLISLCLSAFILIPQLRQMLTSARFKNGSGEEAVGIIGKYMAILKHVHGDYTTRWWSLLGLSLAAALIVTGIIRFRKDHKMVFTSITLILLMVLELFFESINLIWHFGSYIQYPIRNGFIIYFVFAYLACYYAGELYGEGGPEAGSAGVEADDPWVKYNEKWYFGFLFTLITFLIFVGIYRAHAGMPLRSVFHMTSAIMAITFIFYIILFNVRSLNKPLHGFRKKTGEKESTQEPEKIRSFHPSYKWAAGVLAFELLCFGFLLFGRPDFITGYTEEPEQNGDFIYISEQLKNDFYFEPEYLARVKNPDETLNANYGFILSRAALSNWTHMIAPGEQDGAYSWGYSVQFTRLLDAGGTVFTDALLGVRNVISTVPMDERLYELVDETEVNIKRGSDEKATYYMYKPRYTLPFGIKLKGIDDKFTEDANIVKAHNSIYRSVTGSDDDIAYWIVRDDNASADDVSTETASVNGSKQVDASFKIGKETAVYLLGAGKDTEYANSTITVERGDDSFTANVPTIGDTGNVYYPAHFNNNAVYLGTYENEDVKVSVSMDGEKGDYYEVDIIGIDLAVMDSLCETYTEPLDEHIDIGKNAVTFTQAADTDDEYMLLPMTYDKGWKVKDNGKRAKAKSYAGLFTIVPLKAGDNLVTMSFTPPGMRFGWFVTTVTLIVCIGYLILAKVRREQVADKVLKSLATASDRLRKAYAIVFLIVFAFMYVIPIVVGICVLIAG